MKTEVYDSLEEMCRVAADRFINLVDGTKLSIIVPGGNTPRKFYQHLAQADTDWSDICLILSDERMVPMDHRDSNYGMIKETLLKKLHSKNKPTIIPEMEKFEIAYSEKFLDETNLLFEGKLPIEHAFLGIGSDGHTASLFPGNDMGSINDEPFLYISRQGESYQRMTLSLNFLQSIPNTTFLVSGKSKRAPLKAIFDVTATNSESPARELIDQSNGYLSILCDKKAWLGKAYA